MIKQNSELAYIIFFKKKKNHPIYLHLDKVFLQSGLEESSFNPLRSKQIDHPHVYFKKSQDSLKMSCD